MIPSGRANRRSDCSTVAGHSLLDTPIDQKRNEGRPWSETKSASQWLGPAFERANRREGLLRQAPSPISIPFNRRVLQSPSGHFDAQSFGILPDGSANHEFAFVAPVSLNLSADAVIKPQNAFVSQPLDFHANKLPRNATIKSPASTAALMAMKRPLEYVQRSPGPKFIASENSLLSPGMARLSKACLPWGVQRFCSLRGTKGMLQSRHTQANRRPSGWLIKRSRCEPPIFDMKLAVGLPKMAWSTTTAGMTTRGAKRCEQELARPKDEFEAIQKPDVQQHRRSGKNGREV
jgi:hypothetical protein